MEPETIIAWKAGKQERDRERWWSTAGIKNNKNYKTTNMAWKESGTINFFCDERIKNGSIIPFNGNKSNFILMLEKDSTCGLKLAKDPLGITEHHSQWFVKKKNFPTKWLQILRVKGDTTDLPSSQAPRLICCYQLHKEELVPIIISFFGLHIGIHWNFNTGKWFRS